MTHTASTYTAFPNTFRRDILAGKRLIGCWSSLANPITTEILGLAGFDWLLLDAEGVDGIFIGPSDLAAALGHLGNAGHAEVTSLPALTGTGARSASSPPWKRTLAASWNREPVSWRSAVIRVCSGQPRRHCGTGSGSRPHSNP
jgi:hypothetical protein